MANLDETRVVLDLYSYKTINYKGDKFVPVETTNSERKAYTVVLCVFDDGTKLPPLIIFDGMGTRILPSLKTRNSEVVFSGKERSSYMNSKVFKYWWEEVWYKQTDDQTRSETIFFLDSSGSTHKTYTPFDTTLQFFPANSTSRLQPLDLGVNKPFKDNIKLSWEKWMANNKEDRTKKGYRRSVSRNDFICWVEKSWDKISATTVINSFNAIKNGLTEIDDDLIID
jgi:hypothetical protein